MSPPLQPSLPYSLLQSTKFCSLRLTSSPVFLKCIASRAPVVENDQQDPHWPWSFTGVTAPRCLQSTLCGSLPTFALLIKVAPFAVLVWFLGLCLYPLSIALNSWLRRSPYLFIFRL